ncbi:C1 family peptidase [Pseudoduganella ginsengisoli]|uniref:Peptidase C1 n=1 Tax=Pseudoduganella ginsengisoli TaxID=1462440 RepID=A0A6L6Q296_9BURK|nr:C1 family peptidase [Pseudoduganella ginsengisoli]MTW03358.1 peptidase C1 [Pseudoduganella ginsengisoli]
MPATTAALQGGKLIALDARPDRIDLRDLPYRAPMGNLPPRIPTDTQLHDHLPAYTEAGLILDQGQDGACTGFGLAAAVNYLLWRQSGMAMRKQDRVSPRMLYTLARYYDEWPDENYEGSSCRGALKGWQKHGVCAEMLWRDKSLGPDSEDWARDAVQRPLGVYYRIEKQSVVDMQSAICLSGAIYVSAKVHGGWTTIPRNAAPPDSHAQLPRIAYNPEQPDIIGGHAFALVGYNDYGFIVQNSWGKSWGAGGFAVLTYQDWIANGTDAWVVGLGVPLAQGSASTVHVGPQACPPNQARPMGVVATAALQSPRAAFTREDAYQHTLVTGNNGVLLNRMPHLPSADRNADVVVVERPAAWLQQQPAHARKVMLYFHGGLGSEASSIARIQAMAPWFLDNGVYPIFVTWKSGWLDVINDMIADKARELFGTQRVRGLGDWFDDARDRGIEVLAREVLVRSMWSEMKQNVQASADGLGTGITVLADKLAALRTQLGSDVPIHLVGHSAGALIAGRLLSAFRTGKHKQSAASCTLYAPACTVSFALEHYVKAIDHGVLPRAAFDIHTLSDPLELDDSVGPYRKSLLYLVSRSLEDLHKTPVLGLASVYDGSRANGEFWHQQTVRDVRAWQKFFWQDTPAIPQGITGGDGLPAACRLHILKEPDVRTSSMAGGRSVKSTHGAFDNCAAIVSATLLRILGADRLPQPQVDLSAF